ncbi:MAG: glycine/sarcosine/betaine reductase selenoprotein B family protein [Chloroflexota bacterium]
MPVNVIENRDGWTKTFREGWLQHYETTGETDWDRYNRPNHKTLPIGDGIDPTTARLMLVTSAGSYLKDDQAPFDDETVIGDYSTRRYPANTPFDALGYAHGHYDQSAVRTDPQVLVPLKHLADMVAEGLIDELAPEVISFNGYQPDMTRVEDETLPDIIRAAKEMQVTAVLLVPS